MQVNINRPSPGYLDSRRSLLVGLVLVLGYALFLWHVLVTTQESSSLAVLGLSGGATLQEIRKAYRRLSRASHPDKRPDDPDAAAEFLAVSEAYRQAEAEASGGESVDNMNTLAIGLPTWLSEKANEPTVMLGYCVGLCLVLVLMVRLASVFKAEAMEGGRAGVGGGAPRREINAEEEREQAAWEREDRAVVGRDEDQEEGQEDGDGSDDELKEALRRSLRDLPGGHRLGGAEEDEGGDSELQQALEQSYAAEQAVITASMFFIVPFQILLFSLHSEFMGEHTITYNSFLFILHVLMTIVCSIR
jgi:hypothetical protein